MSKLTQEKYLKYGIFIFGLLGLFIASSVAIKVTGGGIPQCLGGSNGCAIVEKSSYSKLLGVHVSYIGIVGYLSILGSLFIPRDLGRTMTFFFSLFGFLFSLYLTYLEIFTIKAICQWCIASALAITVLFILSLIRFFLYYGRDD